MADTIRGDWPDMECRDCGVKGCMFVHWGPLVPSVAGKVGLCGECWTLRDDSLSSGKAVPPVGYRLPDVKAEAAT